MSEPVQIHRPEPLIVMQQYGGETSGLTAATFVVPIPDPRLRTRISILEYVANNQAKVLEGTGVQGRIYLTSRERDRAGRAGGLAFPLVNIAGSLAAGEVFPASTDLNGGSWTWDGAGDEIWGRLGSFTSIADRPIRFQLQVTYTPMVRLCPEEWKNVVAKGVPYSLIFYDTLVNGATGV